MAPGQDWCMQCGHGAPGSVGERSWRPWAIALGATAVLVLAAAGAGYAALSKKPHHAAIKTMTVAQVAPAASAPLTPTPAAPAAPVVKIPPIAKTPKLKLKLKLPATTPTTPAPAVTTPATPAPAPAPTGGGQGTSTTGGESSGEAQPAAILLDTDAASTYNPYGYAASTFGDPSLTIDGDPSTGWSAQVNPATAPAMAEGVVIDLKSMKKIASVKLVTTTPGLTLQIYGASASTAPTSITDPAWVALSRSLTVKKRHAKIGLRNKTKAYRFITVWISGAPASSLGTPEKPGRVTLNEIELFPAG
jgi:hypothetical protein